MLAGAPRDGTPVPPAVTALAAGEPVRPVWENETGGLTFALGSDRFVKWAPAGSVDLGREAARLRWVRERSPVPEVLAEGTDEAGAWLVTGAVPGRNAVDPRWLGDPQTAVTAIGQGLRALHEALPVAACPFTWDVRDRVGDARRRAGAGRFDRHGWHDVHRALDADQALALVAEPPPVDRLVVCHGDSCAPNTLLTDDGAWSGHVDLGSLGVADRWADLAVATWSVEWNYGPGWEPLLLAAYGVDPDPVRTRYYRLLWDLGP